MKFNIKKIEGVNLISIEGNLLGEDNSDQILSQVSQAIEDEFPNFIIDAEKIQYINSTGLSILINTLTKSRKAGGEIILINIQKQLESLLKITKLDSIFNQSESLESALKVLKS